KGDTVGVFQLESGGMQDLCRSFGVDTVEHIIALVALYRPGPLQFKDDFIRRKKGLVPIEYDHPKMEEFLSETYGIMLYQEQIMQVVQALAGFSLGGADILRRAIGKKKPEVLAEQRIKFIEGCKKANNISEELADRIWEKIKMFAGYGFNKSHSAAYGIVSYQTAYLKANYPVEFMAAVMTSELENAEKLAFLINECREMGIEILPPDVNTSGISFSVDKGRIRFGLGAIKGCGGTAAGKIIASRQKEGAFTSFLDFCERCGTDVNSRMLEFLTRAGALDSLGLRRSQILAIAEPMMAFAAEKARDKASGQGSLFDMLGDEDGGSDICSIPIPDVPEFDWDEILKSEKELLGFYVSGHPLQPQAPLINMLASPIRNLEHCTDNSIVRLAGMVSSYTTKISKNSQKPFGILALEDLDASCECMLYEKVLKQIEEHNVSTFPGEGVILEASVRRGQEGEKARLSVETIYPLSSAPEVFVSELYLHIYQKELQPETLTKLAEMCRNAAPGKTNIVLCVVTDDDQVVFVESHLAAICLTTRMLNRIDTLLGKDRYRLKRTECQEPKRRWVPRNQETTVG
ncbi:MAG: DNA polymerase III subunit alpha, partial [Lentisphaeria bacterium]|nr:DNA polymerase III subunit alpha [Lentisphaeria bacterium]